MDPQTTQPNSGADPDDDLNEHVHDPGDPDGVIQAEQERAWRNQHAATPASHSPLPKPKRHWPAVLITIMIIAGATVASYYIGSRKAEVSTAQKPQTTKARPAPIANSTTTITKHYDSTRYTLGIDYPANWLVADAAAKLTVTSPGFAMTSLGGAVTGHVVLTIQNQQSTIVGYPSSGALANLASDKLTYKQPTTIQRAQTYLSYLGYNGSTSGIDALFLTGDSGYQLGQNVPMGDVVKSNPLVSVTLSSQSFSTQSASGSFTSNSPTLSRMIGP